MLLTQHSVEPSTFNRHSIPWKRKMKIKIQSACETGWEAFRNWLCSVAILLSVLVFSDPSIKDWCKRRKKHHRHQQMKSFMQHLERYKHDLFAIYEARHVDGREGMYVRLTEDCEWRATIEADVARCFSRPVFMHGYGEKQIRLLATLPTITSDDRLRVNNAIRNCVKELFRQHKNLVAVFGGFRVQGFEEKSEYCVICVVDSKSFVPVGEELLPQFLENARVDVQEGCYQDCGDYLKEYQSRLRVGVRIGVQDTDSPKPWFGTMTDMVYVGQEETPCLLTNYHVLPDTAAVISQPCSLFLQQKQESVDIEKDLLATNKASFESNPKLSSRERKRRQTEYEDAMRALNHREESIKLDLTRNNLQSAYKLGFHGNIVMDDSNETVGIDIAISGPIACRPTYMEYDEHCFHPQCRYAQLKRLDGIINLTENLFTINPTSSFVRVCKVGAATADTRGDLVTGNPGFIKVERQHKNNLRGLWSVDLDVIAETSNEVQLQDIVFHNQFLVQGVNVWDNFAAKGDSGSLVWVSESRKVMGVVKGVTACDYSRRYTIVCPMPAILQYFRNVGLPLRLGCLTNSTG
eukprot:GILK01003153.1.p1 GENE.GILK01003153.1~~GILK01003153.1.p1  ORF type:complete len:578 (+),score=48.87 GILK01003153.1:55-1788(+)